VVLTYYEDLSNADAAAALDLNIKAFESLLLRARRAMKERLVESADG
jgi:DNA-directed RNA polymerase specialized sigma24 family protein